MRRALTIMLACASLVTCAPFDYGDSDSEPDDTDYGDSIGTGADKTEHARQLMEARDASTEAGRAARLVYVGPRLDETASISDEWLPAIPGTEGVLALGIANAALDRARGLDADQRSPIGDALRNALRAVPEGAGGAVTLISDGLGTDGGWHEPLQELTERGLPLHAVALAAAD